MTGSILGAGWAVAATLLAPALRLNLAHRAAKGREISARLGERRGLDSAPRPPGSLLWIHAASVGETMCILPVLVALRGRVTVLLTTGTATSQALLDRRLPELGLTNGAVLHRFAPLDVPSWVARFLSHWRPDAACFVESELWPNQIAACQARGIPMMLVNARISERSFINWSRVPGFARQILSGFARIQPRGEQDARRLRELGARTVDNPKDLKLSAPPLPVDQTEFQRLVALLADRPVWLAASTHPGEETMVAAAHATIVRTYPRLLTIIAPRHPDRGAALAADLKAPRRGAGHRPLDAGIWIVDTMGEMGLWYRLAPIVLVGRSLIAPGGGQNPLEPARLGCAVAVGPYTDNFTDHVALLRDAGGLVDVSGSEALAGFVCGCLDNPAYRRRMGENAASAVSGIDDLPERTAEALLSLLEGR